MTVDNLLMARQVGVCWFRLALNLWQLSCFPPKFCNDRLEATPTATSFQLSTTGTGLGVLKWMVKKTQCPLLQGQH